MNIYVPLTNNLYMKRFDTNLKNKYSKKVYELMEKNYLNSIKPNTTMINREYRPEHYGYILSIINDEQRIINNELPLLEKFKNVKKNNYIPIILILIIGMLFIYYYQYNKFHDLQF
jgi:hypothetical protein